MAEVREETSRERTLCRRPPLDVAVASLAEGQYGHVGLDQLRALGLSASAVRGRARAGRLQRVYRGVYAVGHRSRTRHGNWIAAVLAYGPTAVLSHRSAAALWGLRADGRDRVDVSVPRPGGRSRPGIDIHRSTTLGADDIVVREGIPSTSVARTLLDLAEAIDQGGLERAIDHAEVLHLFDGGAVEDVLVRARGRRGAGPLRRAIAAAAEPALTASELEKRFLALCLGHRLPRPEVNVWVETEAGRLQVDFLWREQRLVVETDGYEFHRGAGPSSATTTATSCSTSPAGASGGSPGVR